MLRRFFPFTIAQAPEGGYLLDDYAGGLAGYSFRKLSSAYAGNCVKVRRSSDNTTLDVGFSGDYVDTSAITSFVGANNGFIDTWYDQSGNSKNISQSTLASQPQIVSSGSLLVDSNGNLYSEFDGSNDYLFSTSKLGLTDFDNVLVSAVLNKIYTGAARDPFTESSSISNSPLFRPFFFSSAIGGNGLCFVRNDSNSILINETFTDYLDGDYNIINASFRKSVGVRIRTNVGFTSDFTYNFSGSFTANRFAIGAIVRASVSSYAPMLFQEFIAWNGDYYSNQIDIQTQQNNFYNHF